MSKEVSGVVRRIDAAATFPHVSQSIARRRRRPPFGARGSATVTHKIQNTRARWTGSRKRGSARDDRNFARARRHANRPGSVGSGKILRSPGPLVLFYEEVLPRQ